LLRLDENGFTPYMRLPIHDEVVFSIPEQHVEGGAARIAKIMAEDMGPVHLGTDADIGGRSWGSLYDKEEQ
jgi:DNA polymerase-1